MADLYGYISNKEKKPKNFFARSLTRLLMPETAENWFLGSKENEDFLNKWSDSEIPTYEEIQNNYKNGIFSKKDVEDFSNLRNKYDTISANREYTDVRNQNIGQGIVDIGTGFIGGGGALATKAGINVLKPYLGKKIAQTVTQGAMGGGLGGLTHGVGTGIVQEDVNPVTQGLQEGVLGAIGGGLGGYGLGKIAKGLEKQRILGNADNAEMLDNWFSDYVEGITNKTKPLAEYRGLKQGIANGFSGKEHLFIGENAFNAPKGKLMEAQQMKMYGSSPKEIFENTGWFKGVDDKWRFEIPDGEFNENVNWIKLNNEQDYVLLKDLLKNDLLYSSYPEIAELPIVRSQMPWHIKGGVYRYKDSQKPDGIMLNNSLFQETPYGVWKSKIEDIYKTKDGANWKKLDEDWWNNKISNEEYEKGYDAFFETPTGKLFEKLRDNEPKFSSEIIDSINKEGKKSLLHELQHLIQESEGFARGGNENHPQYGHLAGEVESRLVEKRYDLPEIDRKNIFPSSQFDVEPEKQVIEFEDNLYNKIAHNSLNYRDEWVKIDGKDYRILNIPKKDYGKILHIVDTYLKPDDMIGETITKNDDMYKYTFQKISPTEYKFIKRQKLK